MTTISLSLPSRLPIYVALGVLLSMASVAIFPDFFSYVKPDEFLTDEPFAYPSETIWFGTDYLGRDVLSRLLYATQMTIVMAFAATLLAQCFGVFFGLLATIAGGILDSLLCRAVDLVLSIPKMIVGLVAVAALGTSVTVIVGIAAIVYGAGVFRIARALGNDVMKMDFIAVAQARGEGTTWILFGEMLPHLYRPLLSDFALRINFAVLFMSSLSFLGLGVQPPDADWGSLAREGLSGLNSNPYAALAPAVAIAMLSIALNVLVDSVGSKTGGGH